MKNAKNILVGLMMSVTIGTYANAKSLNNTSAHILASVEEKVKVSVANNLLPASLPVLESAAPVEVKNVNGTYNFSAQQRAAIVGLSLYKSVSVEEKVKVSIANRVLPASLPVLESPAPVAQKNVNDTNKHNAQQKAAIVGLSLKSNTTK